MLIYGRFNQYCPELFAVDYSIQVTQLSFVSINVHIRFIIFRICILITQPRMIYLLSNTEYTYKAIIFLWSCYDI